MRHTQENTEKHDAKCRGQRVFAQCSPAAGTLFCYETPQKPMRKQKQRSITGEASAKTRVSAHASKGIAPPRAAADAAAANNNNNSNSNSDNNNNRRVQITNEHPERVDRQISAVSNSRIVLTLNSKPRIAIPKTIEKRRAPCCVQRPLWPQKRPRLLCWF